MAPVDAAVTGPPIIGFDGHTFLEVIETNLLDGHGLVVIVIKFLGHFG